MLSYAAMRVKALDTLVPSCAGPRPLVISTHNEHHTSQEHPQESQSHHQTESQIFSKNK